MRVGNGGALRACDYCVRILRGVMAVGRDVPIAPQGNARANIVLRILPRNAPCVMRVGKWRRDHDIAPGARPCRAPCRGQSRDMQNSQRVLLAKPRTAPMARRRDGDIAPYRNGTAPTGRGQRDTRGAARARDAKPRTAPMARRRDEDIAPYRQATRGVRTATGHGRGCAATRAGGGTQSRTGGAHGNGTRGERAGWGKGAGGG